MKKFMKWSAVTALILLLIGLAMAFLAGSVEGVLGVNELVETVTGGRIHLDLNPAGNWGLTIGQNSQLFGKNSKALYPIEENMIFEDGYDIFSGDIKKYAVGSGVDSMDIRAGGCAFYCKTSEDGNFYVEAEDAGKFQCFIRDNILYVKTIRAVTESSPYHDCEIILYIPQDYSFEKVDVNLGAGLLEMSGIAATEINLEVGAGQILADCLQAQNCDIEVGMGEIILEDIEANTLDAEVGMGHLEVEGTVLGDIHAKCSMGAAELKLTGTAEEFNYTVEAAMGNVTIDGASYSGLTQDKSIDNRADKNIKMECSMGDIQVEFTS